MKIILIIDFLQVIYYANNVESQSGKLGRDSAIIQAEKVKEREWKVILL